MGGRLPRRLRTALVVVGCGATAPIARHVTVVVAPGADAVVALEGYDLDGDPLAARVASTPTTGTLTQLSKVYSTYAYDPKKGAAILEGGAGVTGSRNRVYYARPQYDVERPSGKWGEFQYSVTDASATSATGTVTLVPPSRKLVASAFDRSDEGWTVVRNGQATVAKHDPSSFGPDLNRFVIATDELIVRRGSVETNSSRFMFAAPAAYHGNVAPAYHGSLTFTLGALAGDLTTAASTKRNHNLVELYCATCDLNRGTTLAFPLDAAATTFAAASATATFALPLDETHGWLKDPENELLPWAPPSKCEMIEVLSSLAALRILGDLTDWYESIALDNVALLVPPDAKSHVPVCAQHTPDASSCSC